MIFYFTGTGNSYAAALQLSLRLHEEAVSIAECMKSGKTAFAPKEGETATFVFPVYYGGLPSIVRDFIAALSFEPMPAYVCGVLTYGGIPADAAGMLEKDLAAKGIALDAAFLVKMPANYAVLYEPTKEEAQGPLLEAAAEEMEHICEKIGKRESVPVESPRRMRAATSVMYRLYDKARRTAPFHTNDKCVHCGICAGRCPVGAIEMIDGTPTWVKDRCVFCMSCVRCGAIEYGHKLEGRTRYRHPVFRKKKAHH